MNKWLGIGRLTAEPEVRYSQGENPLCIARYRLAIDRKSKKDGEPQAEFISCIAFGKQGEFAEKYLHKGMKIGVEGRIQTGSYTNKDGQKVYTTDVVVEEQEFAESKSVSDSSRSAYAGGNNYGQAPAQTSAPKPMSADGFMNIPDGIEEELPFN